MTEEEKIKGRITRAENQMKRKAKHAKKKITNLPTSGHTEWYMQRMKTIGLALVNGKTPGQIYDAYKDEWGYSYDSFRQNILKDARAMLASEMITDDKELKIDLTAKYHHLFALNMERDDLREARAVLDSMTRLISSLETNIQVIGNIQTIQLVEVKEQIDLLDTEIMEEDDE